jgi:hypothetical protein
MVKVRQWGDNAAEGKKVHCNVKHDSWTENGSNEEFSADKMLDCDKKSYWCSVGGTNEAIVTIDLGAPMTIFSMRIIWKFFAKRFKVFISNDADSFQDEDNSKFVQIFEQGGDAAAPSALKPDIPIPTFTARLCRLHMLEAGKKFQAQPILGITSLELVAGLHVQINDGALKGRTYKLHQPTRTLVDVDLPATSYRQSLAITGGGQLAADGSVKLEGAKGSEKVKQVMLAKVMQKFVVGTQWVLTGAGPEEGPDPAVEVKSVNPQAHVFVQRLIGKPTLICVKDPMKQLKPLAKPK